jgi:hypothetical protein
VALNNKARGLKNLHKGGTRAASLPCQIGSRRSQLCIGWKANDMNSQISTLIEFTWAGPFLGARLASEGTIRRQPAPIGRRPDVASAAKQNTNP